MLIQERTGLSVSDTVCISGAACSIVCLLQCCNDPREPEQKEDLLLPPEKGPIYWRGEHSKNNEKPIEIMVDEEYLLQGNVNLEDPDIYIR